MNRIFNPKKNRKQQLINSMISKRSQKTHRFPQQASYSLKKTDLQNLSTDQSEDSSDTPDTYRNPLNKEKLQLCKKFMLNGFCPYYSRCKFAHGSHQLRKNNQTNIRYKTKQCGAFFNEGYCHYGERCNFLHRKKQNTIESANRQSMLQNFFDLLGYGNGQSRLMQVLKNLN